MKFISLLLVGITVVWVISNVLFKKSIKTPLITLGISIVLLMIFTLIPSTSSADYTALTPEQGDTFYSVVQKNSESVIEKKLTFKVSEKGTNPNMGIALSLYTSGQPINIMLTFNEKYNSIKQDDIVTVKILNVHSLLGIPMINSELIHIKK